MHKPIRSFLFAGCALFALNTPVFANPEDGVVTSGNATIQNAGDTLNIHQSSDRAVIDWRSFNIGVQETTQFYQPSSGSITLNRVNSADPSIIAGRLSANGNIILINPNGVFFSGTSKVDVGGIVATTSDIGSNTDFMAGGNVKLIKPGNPDGMVINAGEITAGEAGIIGLAAPNVENHGIINARLGHAELASGDTFTIDMAGDGLIEVAVDADHLSGSVINSGIIAADGGTVVIRAAAARDIVDSLVVNSGVLQAKTVGTKDGKIILGAEGVNKTSKQGASYTVNAGIMNASGQTAGEKGGKVEILGDHVALTNTSIIDASGHSGGGDIKVGGDYLGQGDTQAAITLNVAQDSLTFNDALTNGNGGRTIFWSDDTTDFAGSVYARGGLEGGNGGFVETSGKINLRANGYVDLTAEKGSKGTYLLDPADIKIYGNFAPNSLAGLELWLDASDSTKINLQYNSVGSTASGTNATNTIIVSSNTGLQIGTRVRLGSAGSITSADVVGADTYTITNIAGNTITLDSNLSTTYSNVAVYQGYINQVTDKSSNNNNAVKITDSRMPLWISNSLNGLSTMRFDGSDDALTFTEIQNIRSVFYTLNDLGKPAYATFLGHAVDGPFIHGSNGISNLFDATYTNSAVLNGQGYINGSSLSPISMQANSTYENIGLITTGNTAANVIGNDRLVYGRAWNGNFGDIILYNTALSTDNRNLVEQYQSTKWGIALDPIAGAGTEAAEAMDATNGYGSFTTRYLERLANTADIVLQASSSITLDLKNDILDLTGGSKAGKSITLQTSNGNITDVSAGTILTTKTGNNAGQYGNINIIAGGTGSVVLDTTNLNALNGGLVNLTAGGDVTAKSSSTMNVGTLSSGGSINLQATGASSDIVFNLQNTTLSLAADKNLTLDAGRDIKNAPGSAGTIQTSRTGTGGNMNITAAGNVDLRNIILKSGNGNVDIQAAGNASLNAINTGTGSLDIYGYDVTLYGGGQSGASSMVGYWKFDEASGTIAYDYSGQGNNGTMMNGAGRSTDVSGIAGGSNSLLLDGTNDYVEITPTGSLDLKNNLTVSLWYKGSSASNYQGLVSWGQNEAAASAGGSRGLMALQGGELINRNFNNNVFTGTNVVDNAWHQLTMTIDGAGLATIYKDGTAIASGSPGLASFVLSYYRIGNTNYPGGEYAQGTIDNVRMYNAAMSAAEVQSLYNTAPVWQSGTTNIAAGNNLKLDFKDDAMTIASGQNISLTAAGNITTGSAGTITTSGSGAINFTAGGDINITQDFDLNTSGSGGVTLRADNSILSSASGDITTQGGDIILNANRDATGAGAISLGSGTILTSNGGKITLGGGANPETTAALGTTSNIQGIYLNGATLTSGTGIISLRGSGNTTLGTGGRDGVSIRGGSIVQSTPGTITITGVAGNGNTTPYWGDVGVYVTGNGSRVSSTTGNIILTGTGGSANYSLGVGIDFNGKVESTGTGASAASITMTGISTGAGANLFGIATETGTINSIDGDVILTGTTANRTGIGIYGGGVLTTGDANITLNAINNTAANGLTISGTLGGTSATGNISLNQNMIASSAGLNIQTTGNVTFAPYTNSTTVSVAGGGGTLDINSTILDTVTAGTVTIGRNDGTGLLIVGARDWSAKNYNLNVLNGSGRITFSGTTTMGNRTLFVQNTGVGDIKLASGSSISSTAPANAVTLVAGHNFLNSSLSTAPITVTGGGRWLVYSSDSAGDQLNGMTYDLRRFGCTYAGGCSAGITVPGTGNGFVYANMPTLTATPTASTLSYGAAVPSMVGYAYTLTGWLNAFDTSHDNISGTLTGSTTYTQGSNAGTTHNIDYLSGTLASTMGYAFTYVNNASAINVNKVAISVGAEDITMMRGASPTATYNFDGFVLGQDLATSGITGTASILVNPSTRPAGTYDLDLDLSGLTSINYNFVSKTPKGVLIVNAPPVVNNVVVPPTVQQIVAQPQQAQSPVDTMSTTSEEKKTTAVSQTVAPPSTQADPALTAMTTEGTLEITPEVKQRFNLCINAGDRACGDI